MKGFIAEARRAPRDNWNCEEDFCGDEWKHFRFNARTHENISSRSDVLGRDFSPGAVAFRFAEGRGIRSGAAGSIACHDEAVRGGREARGYYHTHRARRKDCGLPGVWLDRKSVAEGKSVDLGGRG